MKNLKAKLMTSVVMLLVAAIALSTASYAWFTISTNPEVKDLKATVASNQNLEIAYARDLQELPTSYGSASGYAEYWGNLIDTSYTDNDNYVVDYNALDTTLRPCFLGIGDNGTEDDTEDDEKVLQLTEVATEDMEDGKSYVKIATGENTYKTYKIESKLTTPGTFYYPVYEATWTSNDADAEDVTFSDGRILYYAELVEVPCQYVDGEEYIDTGVGYLMAKTSSTTEPTAIWSEADATFVVDNGVVYGYYVDYWVRSNLDGILRLSEAANRAGQQIDGETGDDAEPDGEGSWFKTEAVSIAVDDEKEEERRKAVTLASAISLALRDVTEKVEKTDPLDADAKYSVTTPVVVADENDPSVTADKYSTAVEIGKVQATTGGTKIVSMVDDTNNPSEYSYKVEFTDTQNLVELEANLAKALRFYVYLNGDNVKNETASTEEFTNAGTLNLQFKLVGTNAVDGTDADEIIDEPMPIVDDDLVDEADEAETTGSQS